MKELFSVGPFHVYFFGLMVAIAIISATFFAEWQAKKRGIKDDIMFNLVIVGVIAGVVGARLFYILFYNPSFYFSHPMEILKINEGGLSIHGGILVAVVAGYIYSIRVKISFFKLADIFVVAMALAQGIGRVGCDVFGKVMTHIMPWGVNVGGNIMHPAQVYEFILDYILFIILWRKSEKQKYDGQLFVTYIIGFSLIRGIVEFFRINPVIWGPFSISHLLSLVFIVAGLVIYSYLKSNDKYRIKNDEAIIVPTYLKIMALILLIIISLIIFYIVQ
ncbi:prolipoprotein diacylglyceryl transferase [Clostridium frigoris]|uniref:Phosphatidylglycerol--prolipoprotein diacylglyceryl transferase n=1 Tax=Clostridium frigoris TaxID=205327 RepID=A0ABS6BV77_9CLOT|nr:prolipoprotein diacylglyceryl transferase [Clostridium frigoris]MBU3160831.1 prolipoprotein diacylglyceryl transferase [Clostridium frigoris]